MFTKTKLAQACAFTMGLTVLAVNVQADPWTSSPGTKARGMGTAFVAIANDPSAAWHNPAGLYQMKGGNISIESGSAPSFEEGAGAIQFSNFEDPITGDNIDLFYASDWGEMADDNTSTFISYNSGDGISSGWSLYYYEPYFIEGPAVIGTEGDSNIDGYISEEVAIFGGGFSSDLWTSPEKTWFSSFHYGLTLEYVSVDTEGTDLTYFDGNSESSIDIDEIDVSEGFSGSLGFLASIYKGQSGVNFSPTIKLGGVYRTETFSSVDETEQTFDGVGVKTSEFFNSKPASWDVGVSANMNIASGPSFGLVLLELAVQQGETEFNSIFTDMNYEKTAVGASLRWILQDSFFQQVELRIGSYSQESDAYRNDIIALDNIDNADDSQIGMVYPDVDGFTWGLQLALSNGLTLEYASESRDLNNANTCINSPVTGSCDLTQASSDLNETFQTLAIRYNW